MQQQGLPSIVLEIAKDGVVQYAQAYGYADLSTCRLAQLDTPYQIGSVTKQFTASAILQLQAAGLVNLDQPVLTYLPDYTFDPRITLRMLLNQTSGLVDYLTLPHPASDVNGVSEQTVLTTILQYPLDFTPGSAYEYSNSNYFVLGSVIEVVTSMSYAQYLANSVLTPAGLTHTTYEQPLEAAAPYSYDHPATPGATGLAVGIIPDPSVYFASGALWSTVEDLVQWDAKLRDGAVISPAAFTEMITPPAAVPVFGEMGATSTYAMGWVAVVPQAPERPYVWHNGQTLAYTALNALTPETGISVAILTNVDIQEAVPLTPFGVQLITTFCENAPEGVC
jgi:CubicO group peptidase (beta-lactamase class C family)